MESTQTPLEAYGKPEKEHEWLKKLVGTWTSEFEHEGETLKGTETVRLLGDLWVVCEATGQMPGGGEGKTIMTLGFDPQKQRYTGTFIGSMMTHLWIYDGTLDDAERALMLESVGPHMERVGEMAKYRDVIEFVSDDHRTLSGQMLGDDGNWSEFMIAHFRRTS